MKKIRYRRDLHQVVTVPGHAAEIGVAEGNYSEEILRWPVNFPKVYLVDRWASVPSQKGDASMSQDWHDTNLLRVKSRVAEFGDRAVLLRGSSVLMADCVPDRSLSFLYFDADHSYEGLTSDLHAWISKVVEGGIVAFHDFEAEHYGVKAAVHDFCREFGYGLFFLPEDKPDDAGAYFVC